MKLSNFPDTIKSAALFTATTLAACGSAPNTRGDSFNVVELRAEKATGILTALKGEIHRIAHTSNPEIFMDFFMPQDPNTPEQALGDSGGALDRISKAAFGPTYRYKYKKALREGSSANEGTYLLDTGDNNSNLRKTLIIDQEEMFYFHDGKQDISLDCAGPNETTEWKDRVPDSKPGDWACQATYYEPYRYDSDHKHGWYSSAGQAAYFPLGANVVEDFLGVTADIDLVIKRTQEELEKPYRQ